MSEIERIDLHTHSNRSDGALSPAGLLQLAAAHGLQCLALTDHDCVDGIEEAAEAAVRLHVRLIAGTEISASWRSQTIHVLGLSIDPGAPQLKAFLAEQAERRTTRMATMCARLSKVHLPGGELLAWVRAQPGVSTRTHLAAALVAFGHARSTEDAFRRFLRSGRAGYCTVEWPTLEAAIGAIRAAGGVAALAHPARYRLSSGARRRMIQDFAAAGGSGLEVVSGANGAQHVGTCAALARNFGLAGSIGSDFHDPKHVWNTLGRLAKLPDGIPPLWHRFGL